MVSLKRAAMAALAAAIAATGQAQAQPAPAQTAESANRFLSLTFAAGGIWGWLDEGRGFNRVSHIPWDARCANIFGRDREAPAYADPSYQADGTCAGRLRAAAPTYNTSFFNDYTGIGFSIQQLPALDRKINWTRVAEVKATRADVDIKEGSLRYRLRLPSESLATRVAFAMEFLRIECDATASTGF